MTSPGRDLPSDLAARLFRALYTDYDLHTIGDVHVAVPKGAPCYAGRTLSEIARQVSDRHHQDQHPPAVSPGSRFIATGSAGSNDSLTTVTPSEVSLSPLPALQDRE
jgi:hypothetical protein